MDVAPTFLELAGVENPEKMQGRSFVPVLKDVRAPGRDAILTEYFVEVVARVPDWQSVRTDKWKLIHFPDHPHFDELYDLEEDPRELDNRIHDEGVTERKQELYRKLDALLADPHAGG